MFGNWRKIESVRRPPAMIVVAVVAALAGCGGGTAEAPGTLQVDVQAQRVVAASELPALTNCLDQAMQTLAAAQRTPVEVLQCASGTYAGHTDDGTACRLQVGTQPARLHFSVGTNEVSIDAGVAAYRVNAAPVLNLEASPVGDAQPGVMLVRYVAADSLTESIALRAGTAQPGATQLPQLIYLRVQGDAVQEQRCHFDA